VRTSEKLRDLLLGGEEQFQRRYRGRMEAPESRAIFRRARRRNLLQYCVSVAVLLSLLVISIVCGDPGGAVERVRRPPHGSAGVSRALDVELCYQGETLREELTLYLRAAGLTEAEEDAALEECRAKLPELILGENASLAEISAPLELPERFGEVQLRWESLSPDLLGDDGSLKVWNIRGGESAQLRLQMRLGEREEEMLLELRLAEADPSAARSALRSLLREDLDLWQKETIREAEPRLPAALEHGIELRWSRPGRRMPLLILGAACFVGCFLCFRRYDWPEKELKRRNEAIAREFPGMVNKFLLLLSAGLVVPSALQRVAESGGRKGGPLWSSLERMARHSRESNTALLPQIRDFAARSGVQEFMRFVAVVSENMDRGSDLVRKLESENALLWEGRKKQAEEKGRLAESRMSFPLLILLLALILICIAPAMLSL
jgi:hypothetical protein